MSMRIVQRLAAETIAAVYAGKNLQDTLSIIILQNPQLSAADKGMLQDLSYGCQRIRGLLEQITRQLLNKKPPNRIYHLILVALYQLHATHNAPYAIVNEAVRSASQIDVAYKNLVNAVLRRFLREQNSLIQKAQKQAIAQFNLPHWWVSYLKQHYPNHWQSICQSTQQHPPLTLRVNRRLGNSHEYMSQLALLGIEATILDEYAVQLLQPMPIEHIPGFSDGWVSVQDWGAQQATPLLAPKAGETILDACAAPGGKTGHILEWANCQVTALDISEQRLNKVRQNLQRLGLHATLKTADAQKIDTWYDGNNFDAVLADIPCTASGVIRRNPDIKWLRRPDDGDKMAHQQSLLLDALWSVVKPKGRMLLATCSIFVAENQHQLEQFLLRHTDAQCSTTKTLLPNRIHDGFFYALIEKI